VTLPTQTGDEDDLFIKLWAWDEKNLPSIAHATRTAVAATVSVIIWCKCRRRTGPSIPFRLEKTAYRYAGITLAIIVLIPRSAPAWTLSGDSSVNLFVRDSLRQLGARFCHLHSQRPPIRA
jgi:hypothetical protein